MQLYITLLNFLRFCSQRRYERRVYAWAEKVFRGRRYPKLVDLCSVSYKPDFRLIHKDEEEEWYKRMAECKPKERIYDPFTQLPPLLNVNLLSDFLKLYR